MLKYFLLLKGIYQPFLTDGSIRVLWYRGGSRISGKVDHMFKGVGVRFSDNI